MHGIKRDTMFLLAGVKKKREQNWAEDLIESCILSTLDLFNSIKIIHFFLNKIKQDIAKYSFETKVKWTNETSLCLQLRPQKGVRDKNT